MDNLIPPETIWKASLLAKLRGFITERTFERLSLCGNSPIYRTCRCCGNWKEFTYACNLKWCPLCNWKIARKRANLLKHWSKRIRQPKHLVLTRRNFQVLTRQKVRQHHLQIGKLRRSKVWKDVRGGCASTEITHEGRGWHLHTHFLLDVRWLDMAEVERVWAKLVGQELAICKIKDCRGAEYLGEVTKYVVKSAELVSWKPELILEFLHAIDRVRFFATFGSLFHEAGEVRREIAREQHEQHPSATCDCGASDWIWRDEKAEVLHEIRTQKRKRR
jgi:hypothetical protein